MAGLIPSCTMIITFIILAILSCAHSEYMPPGPAYNCPKGTDASLLHPCVCVKGTDAGLYIRCEGAGLAALNVGIGNIASLGLPIEELLLKECKISHLFRPLLHRSTVRVLRILDSPVSAIDVYALAGVKTTLQELYMTGTRIEHFPKDAFKILGNLTTLSIDGHLMTKLDKDIFAGSHALGKLERLHLVNGNITDIPVEAFQNLRKLKTLDLHGNNLSTLKRNQFKGLQDVEVLDLSHNNIVKLDGSHLGDLVKLASCNISHNQIADIPRGMFERNNVLTVLHLENNKLTKLDTNSFTGLPILRRLYLQDNQISDIERGTFGSVTRIGTIDLARNKINKIEYQMFQSTKFAEDDYVITIIEPQVFADLYAAAVNISHNQLDSDAFNNCLNLTVLDSSHSNPTRPTRGAFNENSYPFEFNVADNGLTDFIQDDNVITIGAPQVFADLYAAAVNIPHNQLNSDAFINCLNLRVLDLSHNNLTRFKRGAFDENSYPFEFNVADNGLTDFIHVHKRQAVGNGNGLVGIGNKAAGNNNHVMGHNNVVTGNNNHVTGNNNVVTGNDNVVVGDKSVVVGNNNHVTRNNNNIVGNANELTGDGNRIVGNTNSIKGNRNNVVGDSNRFTGDDRHIVGNDRN